MIRTLTLAILIVDAVEILIVSFVLRMWLRTARKKVIKPVFGLIAVSFFNLGVWNFLNENYLSSALASLFFLCSLALFAAKPFSDMWKACNLPANAKTALTKPCDY